MRGEGGGGEIVSVFSYLCDWSEILLSALGGTLISPHCYGLCLKQ